MTVFVGTSGWDYPQWSSVFYPQDLNESGYLGYAARVFSSLEVNTSFYRLPDKGTLRRWRETTPKGFVFSVKASRYITHMKKLKEADEALKTLLRRVGVLEDKLGPLLFQLPPGWRVNAERLRRFLGMLPDGLRSAFEFRDPSWFCDDVYEALGHQGAAFCIYDLDGRRSPTRRTADFVYLRLHGPDGPYKGRYTQSQLSGYAGAIHSWARTGSDVYCYFDNDESGYAAINAGELSEMVT